MQVDRFRFDVDVEVDVLVCDLGINNLSHTPPGSADKHISIYIYIYTHRYV